jgi:thymidine phosphorylase
VESDRINPAVGLAQVVRLGAAVEKGTPLAVVHAARPEDAEAAARQVRDAIRLSDAPVTPPDLICERVG